MESDDIFPRHEAASNSKADVENDEQNRQEALDINVHLSWRAQPNNEHKAQNDDMCPNLSINQNEEGSTAGNNHNIQNYRKFESGEYNGKPRFIGRKENSEHDGDARINFQNQRGYKRGGQRDSNNWRRRQSNAFPPRENTGGNSNYHIIRRHPVDANRYNERKQKYIPQRDISLKTLENICDMDPDQIICTLESENTAFDRMMKDTMNPDKIVLVMRLIKKLCYSAFIENTSKILTNICSQDFLNQLKTFINDINLQESQDKLLYTYFWNDSQQFWESLNIFYETLLKIRPNMACDTLPKLIKATSTTIRDFEGSIEESTKLKLENIRLKLTMCQEERDRKQILEKQIKNGTAGDLKPPNDFRKISLYPTIDEITRDVHPFIRPIIDRGRYASVNDYLDVQFRLLREDFISPLRTGICKYLEQLNLPKGVKREKINDVYIYRVKFIKTKTTNSKVVKMIKINLDKQRFRLENTKRFMFGSLVCLTKDQFKNVIFGTISENTTDLLKQGIIGVELSGNINLEYNANYIMIECSIYFEPYYQVLKALQIMAIDTFPLQKYIINVETDTANPDYLNTLEKKVSWYDDKRNLIIPILQPMCNWPDANKLELDDSQYTAFYSALTNEFCVIQGPPGTGKTYLGLRIVELLLENLLYWNSGPILIVCYTNHALDQFLEGILNFTTSIVRIGGQSKDEKLQKFNINYLRSCRDSNLNEIYIPLHSKRRELKQYLYKIEELQNMIDIITSNESIIDISTFTYRMDNFRGSWFNEVSPRQILDWLLEGYNTEAIHKERRKFKIAAQIKSDEDNLATDYSDDVLYEADKNEKERLVDDDYIDTDVLIPGTFELVLIKNIDYNIAIQNYLTKIASIDKRIQENPEKILRNPMLLRIRRISCQELDRTKQKKAYIEYRFEQKLHGRSPPPPLNVDFKDVSNLTANERWGLYWYLLHQYHIQLLREINHQEEIYRHVYREYEELKSIEDIRIMKEKLVIGMTTTGAARYQTIIQELKCPIVIVEEAAEVLESHVVVSLTNECKHLILIGDHKQLRPTTSVYHLATKFKLEISLFERMVKNNLHCSTLEVQHRMRPNIAKLIVPSIYPKLENHESVTNYPPVLGVTKNLFFITHNEPELQEADSTSKKNIHEAKFLIMLARHFVLQGYEPSEITILTTYAGQMFLLWKERKDIPCLKYVKITVVDNFQGEENKIILLSLVRSNSDGNIGFLKTDNRVCVALSRAKEGFFIIGNMDCLVKNNSNNIWPQIRKILDEQNAIKPYLKLRCENHPDQYTKVERADDFQNISQGGCTIICGKPLRCEHVCKSLCHIIDREHDEYHCKENCEKILCDIGHKCPDLCFQVCNPCMVRMEVTLSCGHKHMRPCYEDPLEYRCSSLVDVELECKHKTTKPCYRDITTFPCPHSCDVMMLCGHQCNRKCHIHHDPEHLQVKCGERCERNNKNCSTQTHNCPLQCYEPCQSCDIPVQKLRKCNHMLDVLCSEDVNKLICNKRCNKTMECGHKCRQECCEPCDNCTEMVQKTLPECGHKLKVKCCEEPNRRDCKRKCPLLLPCGHECMEKCNNPCTKNCEFLVDCPINAACGHIFKIPCSKKDITDGCSYDILKYCHQPCGITLNCLHRCKGTCGMCAQGRIHLSCQQNCGTTLICGHACEISCFQTCRPCQKKCTYQCIHFKCGRKCAEPCILCQKPCQRRCKHIRCTKRCGEMCNVEPCNMPCDKKLRCKHPCIGFCGEPCPPICRTCHPDNDIFVGKPDARFVYLEQCRHVIESDALDRWVHQASNEIKVKTCPKCNTIITKSSRYLNYIKKAYIDITEVKKKQTCSKKALDELKNQVMEKVNHISYKLIEEKLSVKFQFLEEITDRISYELLLECKGRKQTIDKNFFEAYDNKLQMVEKIIKIYKKCIQSEFQQDKGIKHANFLFEILYRQNNRISKQQIYDFNLELTRFEKFVKICNIEADPNFSIISSTGNVSIYEEIWKSINSIDKYSDQQNIILEKMIKDLVDLINTYMVIAPEEEKIIVKTTGMSQGHWYKCPNGHIYCIAESTKSTDIGKCSECVFP